MKTTHLRFLIPIFVILALSGQYAQNAEQPAYMNRALSPQQRAADPWGAYSVPAFPR